MERQSPWPRAPPPPPAHHTDSGARMSVSPSVTDGANQYMLEGFLALTSLNSAFPSPIFPTFNSAAGGRASVTGAYADIDLSPLHTAL